MEMLIIDSLYEVLLKKKKKLRKKKDDKVAVSEFCLLKTKTKMYVDVNDDLVFIVCCNIREGILSLLQFLKQLATCKIKGMINNLIFHFFFTHTECERNVCTTRYI